MKKVHSWGQYPYFPQIAHECYWRADLPGIWQRLRANNGTTLPFGRGRSYGDSCLAASDHVLDMHLLNRFIHADWDKGIIRAEAGLTLQDLLRVCIPRGWFLPVTPGTQYVTLGGAVANDVHGKNHHHKGTFGCYVQRFNLLRSDGVAYQCSSTENTAFYNATIGGLGLTGIIEWVELQLMPIRSSQIQARHIRFHSLKEFFALSLELDAQHEYAVAWFDCVASGASRGRGIFTVGDHATEGELSCAYTKKCSIPFSSPVSLVNTVTLKCFNALYYRHGATETVSKIMSYEPFFYPLDRILHWNRLYGRKGFQQYQCVVPEKEAENALNSMLAIIEKSGAGSFLAVLKRCGAKKSPGLLSFPFAGMSLALDFPYNGATTDALFAALDAVVREAKGRLYPAKDAHMSEKDFKAAYPAWTQVEALRDPALNSRFWRRVTQ